MVKLAIALLLLNNQSQAVRLTNQEKLYKASFNQYEADVMAMDIGEEKPEVKYDAEGYKIEPEDPYDVDTGENLNIQLETTHPYYFEQTSPTMISTP